MHINDPALGYRQPSSHSPSSSSSSPLLLLSPPTPASPITPFETTTQIPPLLPKSKLQKDLELTKLTLNTFENKNPIHALRWNLQNNNTYGGALLYQALLAGYLTIPNTTFRASTLHCYFLDAVKLDKKVLYQVNRLRDGKGTVHREIKAYQDNKCKLTVNVAFLLQTDINDKNNKLMKKFGPQPEINYAQVKPQTKAKLLKGSDGGLSDYHVAGLIANGEYVRNATEDKQNYNVLELYQPKLFFNKNDKQCYDNSTLTDEELSSDVVTNRETYGLSRVVKPSSANIEYNTIFEEAVAEDLYLCYISDFTILSAALPILGCQPYGSEAYLVSLDHSIYFHRPQSLKQRKCSMYDWHIQKNKLIKALNGQLTMMMVILNKFGETVAVAMQEGICQLNNKEKKIRLPGEKSVGFKSKL